MKIDRNFTSLAAALAFAAPLSLQAALPFTYPLPQDGAYLDPARPGTGYWLDYNSDGAVFGAIMTYDASGRPTFYTVGGTLGIPLFGHYIEWSGTVFETTGGACLGCAYRAPTATATSRRMFVRPGISDGTVFGVQPTEFRIESMPVDENATDRLLGNWLFALGEQLQPTVAEGALATVSVERFGGSVTVAEGTGNSAFLPPDDAQVDRVTCIASCADFDRWLAPRGDALLAYRANHAASFGLYFEEYLLSFGRSDGAGGYVLQRDAQLRVAVGSQRAGEIRRWEAGASFTPGFRGLRLHRDPVTSPCDGDRLCRDDAPGTRKNALVATIGATYYDPTQPGMGLFVDAGREGNTFMTLMTYEDDGRPTFYTLGGPIRPLSVGSLFSMPGVQSPIYRSTGGQAFGSPTYRAPTTAIDPSLGVAKIWFDNARSLQMEIAGKRHAMESYEPDGVSLIERLDDDEWQLLLHDRLAEGGIYDVHHERLSSRVRLETIPTMTIVSSQPVTNGAPSVPARGVRLFKVACESSCGDLDEWLVQRGPDSALIAWINGGVAIFSQVRWRGDGSAVIEPGARQYTVQLSEELLVGHALPIVQTDGSLRINGGQVELLRRPPPIDCASDGDCR